jgi:Ca-activated chloride channel family protein
LFRGSEIMMVGRYRDGGKHTFTIAGTLFGQPVKYTVTADLPRGTAEPAHEFLAPLWAARKIGYLLQEIRLHGEVQELIEEVVRLSRQYGIVTEYTEFLALGGKPVSGEEAVREAKKRLSVARAEQAGQWAVNQAFNDRALQNRAVASGAANVFRDRRGQVMAATNISQIGRRAFYLKDGQWIDAEDPGTRKTRVVKLFSKEYFDLLRSHPDFARAQQLGWALSINVGQERIVLEKDGKQQDESLRVKPETVEEFNQEPDFNRLQQIPQNRIPRRNQRQEPGPLQNQRPIP